MKTDSPNITKLTAEETIKLLEDNDYEIPDDKYQEVYNKLVDYINKNTSKFHCTPQTMLTKLKKDFFLVDDIDSMEFIHIDPIIL